jgi:hypothetical protein
MEVSMFTKNPYNMKRILIFSLLVSYAGFGQNQDATHEPTQAEREAIETLTPILTQFNTMKAAYDADMAELSALTLSLDPAVEAKLVGARKKKEELDVLFDLQQAYKKYFVSKGVAQAFLDTRFPTASYAVSSPAPAQPNQEEKAIYMLYGDNKLAEEELFKDPTARQIFKDILSKESKESLGTFGIPGDFQKVELFRKRENKGKAGKNSKGDAGSSGKAGKTNHENGADGKKGEQTGKTEQGGDEFESAEKYLYFSKINFSIRQGNIAIVTATMVNAEKNQEFYFVNKIPISMLTYLEKSRGYYLLNVNTVSTESTMPTSDQYDNHYIRLSDVLMYKPEAGNNFVPDDIEYTFPTQQESNPKESRRREYVLGQNTNLQNMMELRTYTDFLGLFDESANGIIQLEGSADFFITPFPVLKTVPLIFFNKVSPYVRFTRLDEDHRALELATTGEVTALKDPLQVLERSYLDMGSTVDLVTFSFGKRHPFCVNLYHALRYQIASIQPDEGGEEEEAETINFKTIGNGVGMRVEVKRFNNFGFHYSPEFTYYNHMNRLEMVENPKNYWVFRNEAEIFYYPGKTKNQSIFLRLRSFLNIDDGENSFFQLQFGYRFSIGLGNIKSKN